VRRRRRVGYLNNYLITIKFQYLKIIIKEMKCGKIEVQLMMMTMLEASPIRRLMAMLLSSHCCSMTAAAGAVCECVSSGRNYDRNLYRKFDR